MLLLTELSAKLIDKNLGELVDDRIKNIDQLRKASLLRKSINLKAQSLTVLPFPEFNSVQGRRLTTEETDDVISYTKVDALNILMALAGNDEEEPLRRGSLEQEVKQNNSLVKKKLS